MSAPTDLPRWAETGGGTPSSDITEPTSGEKDSGWTVGQKPPAQYFNWWMWLVYKWISWLQSRETVTHVDASEMHLPSDSVAANKVWAVDERHCIVGSRTDIETIVFAHPKVPPGATITGLKVFAANSDAGSENLAVAVSNRVYDSGSSTDGYTDTVMESGGALSVPNGGAFAWRTVTLGAGPYEVGEDGLILIAIKLPVTTSASNVQIKALRIEYTN
jgi:hypothetical protein